MFIYGDIYSDIYSVLRVKLSVGISMPSSEDVSIRDDIIPCSPAALGAA